MTFESLLLIIAVSLVFGIMIGAFFERIREFVVTLYLRLTFKPKMLNLYDVNKASGTKVNKPPQ